MGEHHIRRAIVGMAAGAFVIGFAGCLIYALVATLQENAPDWRQQRLAFLKATYDRIQVDIAAGGNAAPSWRRQAESVLQDMAAVAKPMPVDSVPSEIRALLSVAASPDKDGVVASAETTGTAETSAIAEPVSDRPVVPPSGTSPTAIAAAPHPDDGAAATPQAAVASAPAPSEASPAATSDATSPSQGLKPPLFPTIDPPPPPPQPEDALQTEKTDRGLRAILPVAVLFDATDAALAPAADVPLSRLAELIGNMEPHEIVINVHSDASGAADLALSKKRAHAIVAWLAAHGPQYKPHFVERGYGSIGPSKLKNNASAPNNTEVTAPSPKVEILLRRN